MRNSFVYGVKDKLRMVMGCGLITVAMFMSVPVEADMGKWRKSVVKRIIKNHIYPRSAISREIEGKAKVKITITRGGDITGYEVVEQSGESVLDNAIPKMMDKMNPLPAPPDELPDANLTFVIPITWRLQ